MEEGKRDFIEFLLQKDVLKFGEFNTKSGRPTPYFVNAGDLNTGDSIRKIGQEFARYIQSSGEKPNVIFGPAYKGISLSVATSMELENLTSKSVGFAFDRKEEKEHGEATGLDLQKKVLVGAQINDGDKVIVVEDVFTTGQTKYEAIQLLNKMAPNLSFPYMLIAVDRQEIDSFGNSALREFSQSTKIPVISVVSAADIHQYLSEKGMTNERERLENYLRVYGIEDVKKELKISKLEEQTIIPIDRSVVVALDVRTIGALEEVVIATADNPKIGGYKTGFLLGYRGLQYVVETIRKHTQKPIIHDHQKAGTDIPMTGKDYAWICKESGVDAVILFPQSGPETEYAWMMHALDQELKVIVGGPMTHAGYKESEGGYLSDKGVERMIRNPAKVGINNFVAPGTKLDDFKRVIEIVQEEGIENPHYFAPGFVAQGGNITDAGRIAGKSWHAIVGTGIYAAENKREAALRLTSQL